MKPETRKLLEDCQALIADMSQFAGSMALQDYALLNEVPGRIKEALKERTPRVHKINEFIPPEQTDEERWAELDEIEAAFEKMETPVTDEGEVATPCPAKSIVMMEGPYDPSAIDPWLRAWMGDPDPLNLTVFGSGDMPVMHFATGDWLDETGEPRDVPGPQPEGESAWDSDDGDYPPGC